MGQGVPGPSYDAGSHRPPGPSLDHLRDECRELSTPRRTRPQAWSRAAADARDNQGNELIDAQRQSTSGTEKKCLRTSGPKAIMTSLPAAASNSDCRRCSHPDCRATRCHWMRILGHRRASAGVIRFVESLPCTAGPLAGTLFKLRPWQRKFIKAVYATDKA